MEIVPVNIKENVTFIKKAIQPMKWKWFFSEGSDIDLIDLNIGTIKPKPKKALYMTFFRIKSVKQVEFKDQIYLESDLF